VDLTVHDVGKIWVNGLWYKFQYEGLHLICTNWGCYGYLGRNCPTAPNMPEVAEQPQHTHPHRPTPRSPPSQPPIFFLNIQTTHSSVGPTLLRKENEIENFNANKGEKEDLHGDWLIVNWKRKPTKPNILALKNAPNKSNRFISLSPVAHNNKASTSHQTLPPLCYFPTQRLSHLVFNHSC